VDFGDDRLATALDAAQRVLQVENRPAQPLAGTAIAIVLHLLSQPRQHVEVNARREVLARGR